MHVQLVCVDLQAVRALEFFGELYSLAKGYGPFLRGVWAGFRERGVLFLVTTSTLPSLQAYSGFPLRSNFSPFPYPVMENLWLVFPFKSMKKPTINFL